MLGEDVEDQLRPVDDARRERVLERALLRRRRARRRRAAPRRPRPGRPLRARSSLPLPTYVRGSGRSRSCTTSSSGSTPAVRASSRISASSSSTSALRGKHGEDEPALGLDAVGGIRLRCVTRRLCRYARAVTSLAERLAARTLELVDIPSESRDEAGDPRARLGSSRRSCRARASRRRGVPVRTPRRPDAPLVVLAGHYDTVPGAGQHPGPDRGRRRARPRRERHEGRRRGRARARARPGAEPTPGAYDVALLLFGREELPEEFNPLPALFAGSALLARASLAVLLEPTDCRIQAGCVGNLNARLVFHGVSGHAARPWLADNAIERAIAGLAPIAALERREAVVGGLPFYEVVTITRLHAGIADNVVPGPGRRAPELPLRRPIATPTRPRRTCARWFPTARRSSWRATRRRPAPVDRRAARRRLREAGDLELEPKQAWTNVADFTARGIDAVNFGPGATRYAPRPRRAGRDRGSGARVPDAPAFPDGARQR